MAKIKEKGKEFEILIAKEIEAEGLGAARREVGSGSGKRKGDIFSNLPFLLECKNQPSVKIQAMLNWIDQAKEQARIGNWSAEKWALIFQDPRSTLANPQIYGTLDFWQLIKLFKKDSKPRVKEPDRELKWHLESLKNAINRVIKDLK